MHYIAADDRYSIQPYRRCGRSGLKLPAISLGFWHNFGDDKPLENQRAVMRRAFDLGVTHFDLANNYGPPYGSAETNVGRILARGLRRLPRRAGHLDQGRLGHVARPVRRPRVAEVPDRQPGPSLKRLGLDYVDIFYHHRPDPETPLEETMGALDAAVRAGKALYVGVSSYSPAHTAQAAEILRELGTPLLIHQPSYSMFNRWIEPELLDVLEREGVGCIAFTALAQGLLTDRYLNGVPADSRAAQGKSLEPDSIEANLDKITALNEIAADRGQSLAQLALAWVLRDAARHVDAHRRQQRAAGRGQRGRRAAAGLHRRGAGRYRPARRRVGRRPLGRRPTRDFRLALAGPGPGHRRRRRGVARTDHHVSAGVVPAGPNQLDRDAQ